LRCARVQECRPTDRYRTACKAGTAPHDSTVLVPLLLVVGFVIGFIVARWFALTAPAAFGVYVAVASEVDEVPPWVLGLLYGIVAALGVAGGVVVRRRLAS
jgi:hypothetical protein